MHWFEGSIAEAVTLSKKRNAIFVVFVEGDNELSAEMSATIEEPVVLKQLTDESSFLAIKLKSGSVDYTHFAQLYQFVPVPSLFFIGRNGTPLEVVCAGVRGEDLANRVTRILDEHRKDKTSQPIPTPHTMQPSTSAQAIRQTAELIHAEASSAVSSSSKRNDEPEMSIQPAQKVQKTEHPASPSKEKTAPEYEVVCEGDVCVRRPKTNEPGPSSVEPQQVQSAPAPSVSQENIEEKLEKAKELLEARRREKEDKEKELEKQKEIERRTAGQGVAELKRWQEDQEMKQIQEERKREKLENNLARQRILEQIAQDRAERKAKDSIPTQETTVAHVNNPPTVGDTGPRTRIQFKLPDGASHTAHFDNGDTLAVVHKYVQDNLQMSNSNFSLWTAFPRRELTEPSSSLRELQLTPRAAVLILPRNVSTVSSNSTFSSFIALLTQIFTSLILDPSYQAYNWLRAHFFGPVNRPGNPTNQGQTPDRGLSPNRGTPAPNTDVRRRGNVHRLHGDETKDDDNNTWNGNSTQQM